MNPATTRTAPTEPAEETSRRKTRRESALPFLAPAVGFLALFTLYPFVYSVIASLFEINLTQPHWGSFQGSGNFGRLFGDHLFQTALLNTLLITVGSIVLELVVAFLMAHLFVAIADLRGSQVIRTLYILPMMITPVVTGLLWNYILDPFWGVMNYLLTLIGIGAQPWFSDASTALPTVILVNVWQWNPFLTLLTMAGLLSIPKELYEAAQLDGAHWYHLVTRVEVPMIWNTLMVGVIFRMIDNFRIFDIIYASTRGGPAAATEVLSLFVYRQTFQYFNVGYGAAAAVIVLFIAVFIANLAAKLIQIKGAYA